MSRSISMERLTLGQETVFLRVLRSHSRLFSTLLGSVFRSLPGKSEPLGA